jgi:hypothetical protein
LTWATTIQVSLNFRFGNFDAWRATIDHHSDAAAMGFAKGCDAKELAECVGHVGRNIAILGGLGEQTSSLSYDIASSSERQNNISSLVFLHRYYGRGGGVGRTLGAGFTLGVGVGLGVDVSVGVGVAVAVPEGVAVAVAVGIGLAVGVGVGEGPPCAQYLPPVLKKRSWV